MSPPELHPDDASAGASRMRVAVVSAEPCAGRDPYLDAVLPSTAVVVGPMGAPDRWLSPAYLEEHAGDIDVVHVHDVPPGTGAPELESWCETVRRLRLPLVLTVSQLRDPAADPDGAYPAALGALLATAEVVLTLTPGAADEIADRFGRTAIVVAHPSVAVPAQGVGSERGLVGLVLAPQPAATAETGELVRAALSGAISGGGRLRVLSEPGPISHVLRPLAAEHEVELVTGPGPGAPDWPARLQELHVAVLPERGRTHSLDLEICRDVGTRVVAPSCGYFADQWSEVVTYGDDEQHGFDPVSLTAAVAAALTRPAPRPADQVWRTEQRAAVQRVHAEVYARVIADCSA